MKIVDLKIKDDRVNITSKDRLNLTETEGILEESATREDYKQVSILSEAIRKLVDGGSIRGLCTERFYENITIRDFDPSQISIGSRLKINDSLQEVRVIGKGCYEGCQLLGDKGHCQLYDGVVFTRILKAGTIAIGDEVDII